MAEYTVVGAMMDDVWERVPIPYDQPAQTAQRLDDNLVGCVVCNFKATTEAEVHAHNDEAHPGLRERAAELKETMMRGEITARGACETLEREFGGGQ